MTPSLLNPPSLFNTMLNASRSTTSQAAPAAGQVLDASKALEHLKTYAAADGLSLAELHDGRAGGVTYNDFLALVRVAFCVSRSRGPTIELSTVLTRPDLLGLLAFFFSLCPSRLNSLATLTSQPALSNWTPKSRARSASRPHSCPLPWTP